MRTIIALLAGIVIGAALMLAGVMLTGGWYEYHTLDTGDDFVAMVNRDGWEPIGPSTTPATRYYRRPRFRLH